MPPGYQEVLAAMKLEEQRAANELLKNSTKKYKQENHEHLNNIAKLEQELEEFKGDKSDVEEKELEAEEA